MSIVKAPNKILDLKTKEVTKIDSNIKKLVNKMFEIKNERKAVGLAANQIGEPYKIAITGYKAENDKEKDIPEYVLINPKILVRSKDKIVQKERCLSVEKEYDVPRSKKIIVEYQDLEGNKRKIKTRGILSRIIQHEIDHLEGKKISDYK